MADMRVIDSIKTITPKRTATLGVAFLVLLSAAAGFVGGWAGAKANRQGAFSTETSQKIISNESELVSSIAKSVGPSVVSVNVLGSQPATGFFGVAPQPQQSAGTGFIVNEAGVVVTNRHVVENAEKVSITLSDGTELDNVEILGKTNPSESLDVAFLKIKDAKGKQLKPIALGDSSKVEVGDKVVAIGNALGQFQNTVTTGIISGYGREVEASDERGLSSETLQNLFQTDAAINQGNSGGPLVDLDGRVVGMNTAVAGDGAENIGFAIPINDMKGLIASVLGTGKLERPFLGVRYVTLTDDVAFELHISTKRGAYILPAESGEPSIVPDSPASKAGLREKDIITKLDGTEINEKNSLTSLIGKHKVGDKVSLTVIRDGKEQTMQVTLEAAQ